MHGKGLCIDDGILFLVQAILASQESKAGSLRKEQNPPKTLHSAPNIRDTSPTKSGVSAVNMQRYVGSPVRAPKTPFPPRELPSKPGVITIKGPGTRRRLLGLGLLRSRLRLRLLLLRSVGVGRSGGGLGLGRSPEGLQANVSTCIMHAPKTQRVRTRLSRSSCMMRVLSL